jgi:hypothetical protein
VVFAAACGGAAFALPGENPVVTTPTNTIVETTESNDFIDKAFPFFCHCGAFVL